MIDAKTFQEAVAAANAIVHTVAPTVKPDEFQVAADRRNVKGQPELKDEERIRRIVIPCALWDGMAASYKTEASTPLYDLLVAKLREVASMRLRDLLTEEPMLRTVSLDLFTVPALLAWNTEAAAQRGGIPFDKEEVLAWFEVSQLRTDLLTKHGNKAPAVIAFLRTRYSALAARNHGLVKPEDATKLVALLTDADLTGPHAGLVEMLANRLVAIEKALTAKLANEAAISLDDI